MPSSNSKFTAINLVAGVTYIVIAEFKDYDGVVHQVGEQWRFREKNFLPYEDGLTLSIEQKGQRRSIRLQWRAEAQAEIIDHFSDYVEAVEESYA